MSIYIYVCLVYLVIKSYKLLISCCYNNNNNNNNNNNIYLLQLSCYPGAVVILHVNKHEIGYY